MSWAALEPALEPAYRASLKKTMRYAKPNVVKDLLEAPTPKRVLEICETNLGSVLVGVYNPRIDKTRSQRRMLRSHFFETLSENAERFIAAKNHAKYPQKRLRSSLLLDQLWFLSRAIAAADRGMQMHTALKLGSERPEQKLVEQQANKSEMRTHDARKEAIRRAKVKRLADDAALMRKPAEEV